jgi:hypothetical protein
MVGMALAGRKSKKPLPIRVEGLFLQYAYSREKSFPAAPFFSKKQKIPPKGKEHSELDTVLPKRILFGGTWVLLYCREESFPAAPLLL